MSAELGPSFEAKIRMIDPLLDFAGRALNRVRAETSFNHMAGEIYSAACALQFQYDDQSVPVGRVATPLLPGVPAPEALVFTGIDDVKMAARFTSFVHASHSGEVVAERDYEFSWVRGLGWRGVYFESRAAQDRPPRFDQPVGRFKARQIRDTLSAFLKMSPDERKAIPNPDPFRI